MKRIVLALMVVVLVSCGKDEGQEFVIYSASVNPVAIFDDEEATISVEVKASAPGQEITITLLSDPVAYWEEIPEFENFSNHVSLGVQELFRMNEKTMTFELNLTPLKILPMPGEIPFEVWIKGGNENMEGYSELYGIKYANSYYIRSWR